MKKLVDPLSITASLLIILDFFSRRFSINFISKPLFAINIVEIILIALIAIVVYKYLTMLHLRKKNLQRAENFIDNWKKFKSILEDYSKSKEESLQKEYDLIREKLDEDFNYFAQKIQEIQASTHRDSIDLAIHNFEMTFFPRSINEWESKVRRRIPQELDSFDYLLIALKEYYKRSN